MDMDVEVACFACVDLALSAPSCREALVETTSTLAEGDQFLWGNQPTKKGEL